MSVYVDHDENAFGRMKMCHMLAAIWLVAQLGSDGTSARCWIMRGVEVRSSDTERHWLATESALDGWLQRVEVRGGDVDAAARELGLRDAKGCG